MKQLIAIAILALLIPTACAQNYSYQAILGGTANVAASITNTTFATTNTAVLVSTKGVDVAIQPMFKLDGAGTSAVVLKFDESVDNANWTVAARSITITADGTNLVSKASNFTIGAVGYLRLSQIENPNASAITNLTVRFSQKY